jgi:hypothetical protein
MPPDRREAHLKALRALCDQAERLRQVSEELCQRLTAQMEATRASVQLTTERRRKIRSIASRVQWPTMAAPAGQNGF